MAIVRGSVLFSAYTPATLRAREQGTWSYDSSSTRRVCVRMTEDNESRDGGLSRGSRVERLAVRSKMSSSVRERTSGTADRGPLTRESKLNRPAVILPGLGNNSGDYNSLVKALEALEVPATVVQVARIDWLRNAAGLLDGNYWKGMLRPRPVLDWYLKKVDNAIQEAKSLCAADNENGKVSLIAHSAGGWLARVYLAEFGTEDISLLLTLGTPHHPPPRGVPGVFDQTRGLLYYAEENFPGAYHAPDVKYVCVAGKFIKGVGTSGSGDRNPGAVSPQGVGTVVNLEALTPTDEETIARDLVQSVSVLENEQAENNIIENKVVVPQAHQDASIEPKVTFQQRFIGAGYKQVCGRSDVWGDGVVPEESAYLKGAVNITLNGVYHSPVGANDLGRPWYGSAGQIDHWVGHLLE